MTEIDDVETTTSLIKNVEKNKQNRLDAIDRQVNSSEITQELHEERRCDSS